MRTPTVKIAACHSAPVFLDPSATTTKALTLIDEAASNGANLIVFSESFLSGFPLFASVGAPIDSEGWFQRFVEASVYADGPEIDAIRQKAKERRVVVSLGFSERSRRSIGCVWNSNLLIGESGEVLVHHRKLAPTYWEKLVWSSGDGYGLVVTDTERAGRVGALICGENTNPLARFSLAAQAEQIHVCAFPPAWPVKRSAPGGGYDNKTANSLRAAAHSFEAKCFTVMCAGFLDAETKRIVAQGEESRRSAIEGASQAHSAFYGPDGRQIGEEACDEEKIIYCDIDTSKCFEGKQLHDVVGGYQRYDVFDLRVTRKRDEPVTWTV